MRVSPSRSKTDEPVVLFDGDCGLCNAAVRWIARSDSAREFGYAPLGSRAAAQRLSAVSEPGPDIGVESTRRPDAVAFVQGDRVAFGWAALVAIARRLPFPRSVLGRLLALVPDAMGDALYRFVAKRRRR